MRDGSTLKANFRILVFLYSNLQGLFAYHDIRLQLKHTKFSKYSLDIIKNDLTTIKNLLSVVKSGTILFGETENNPIEKENLNIVNSQLQKLKLILTDFAIDLEKTLNDKEYYTVNDFLTDAIAGLSFKAYSRDNFAKAHLEIEEELKKDNALEIFKDLEIQTKAETKQVHTILNTLKEPEKITNGFYEYIRFFSRPAVPLIRCNIHDLNQFLVYGKEPFSFANGDFSIEEEMLWKEASYGAIEAGYWRACSFDVYSAIEWFNAGIGNPIDASDWNLAGFKALRANEWLKAGFTPFYALQWVVTEMPAQACAMLVKRGYHTPNHLPKNQAELKSLIEDIAQHFKR